MSGRYIKAITRHTGWTARIVEAKRRSLILLPRRAPEKVKREGKARASGIRQHHQRQTLATISLEHQKKTPNSKLTLGRGAFRSSAISVCFLKTTATKRCIREIKSYFYCNIKNFVNNHKFFTFFWNEF